MNIPLCPKCGATVWIVDDEDEIDAILTFYCPSCSFMWDSESDISPAMVLN